MKKLSLLSKTFIFIIFFVLIFVVVKTGLITLHIIDFYKGDNWKVVEKSDDPIYDKIMSLETNIENRINNYFPLYQNINSIYFNSIINIDSLYLNDIYLKNNSDNEKLFFNKNNNAYFIVNNYSNGELNKRLESQLNRYLELSNKYTDVNFYMYIPYRYEMVNNINNIKSYFIENKLDNYNKGLDNFKISYFDSGDDYYKYFYKSDHHYNAYGALKVYKDIVNLLDKEDNKEYKIKEVLEPYYGSMAKSVLSTRVSDTLTAIDYPNNLEVNIKDSKFKPLDISKKNNPFYDYYVGYFDGQYDEVIYTNNDIKSDDNLLIISDSLAWQIDYLIAQNYKNTYVINLRYGKFKDNDLNLSDYVENKNVKNVLYLQEAEVELFDLYNLYLNKGVK